MFVFKRKQEILDVGGIVIGGQPGELPTVCVGTMFYNGQKVHIDESAGTFDKEKAESVLKERDEFAEETGNPSITDIYIPSSSVAQKYIDFVVDRTDAPFMIDSSDKDVLLASARYVGEVGLSDRAIYNSIDINYREEEKEVLLESGIGAAIVLAYNVKDPSPGGKVEVLENGAGIVPNGLLVLAKECGITKTLIDTAMMPLGSGGGHAVRSTYVLKSKYGLPVGNGIHNAPSAWSWLRNKRSFDPKIFEVSDAACNLIEIMAGGDFVLYGPIENSRYVFPAVAMCDSFIAEAAAALGTKTGSNHPLRRLT